METVVRPARNDDLPAITALYNRYVEDTSVTFDDRPFTAAERQPWFDRFGATGRYRLLVAEEAEEILGYAGTIPFRAKAAYETSVETTIYLGASAQGRGMGQTLYEALFRAIANEDIHRILAGVTLPNPASVALHQKFGFTPVGIFREVGRKFGRYWDVAWYERPNHQTTERPNA